MKIIIFVGCLIVSLSSHAEVERTKSQTILKQYFVGKPGYNRRCVKVYAVNKIDIAGGNEVLSKPKGYLFKRIKNSTIATRKYRLRKYNF